VIYRIGQGSAQVLHLIGAPIAEPAPTEPDETSGLPTTNAYANLSRNLNYARNLTSAGSHLEQLQVNLFEVTDVYRAAWVQAVAALDHWVHQEIYDRMLSLTETPTAAKPDGYAKFELPLGVVERVQKGQQTLKNAVKDAMQVNFAYKTYQNPDKIREGLAHIADVKNLWARVANVLNEQVPGSSLSAKQVEQRLREIVQRRNKIAHEYDEDPAKAPAKRHIDVGTTMETIDWLDQLALALLVVLDQE
jgi:restriction system protein